MKKNKRQAILKKETIAPRKDATWVFIILIAAFGFFAYSNSLGGKFIWDDNDLVKNNAYIKDWSKAGRFFVEDIGAGGANRYTTYRPLPMMTYMADYSIWKLDARGYHATNIILHVLAALCLFWLLALFFGNPLLSFVASLFFVIHPIHSEAVSYISGRADPLVAIFMFLTFVFYLKQSRWPSRTFFSFMAVSYLAALLSKEYSLILPALILFYSFVFKKKAINKEFFALSAMAIVYAVLRLTVLKFVSPNADLLAAPTTLGQRLPGFFVAICNYARLLLAPLGLHMEYGGPLFGWTDAGTLAGIAIVIIAVVVSVKSKEKNKLAFFCIGWFFVAILPVSHLYPVNAYMAEHWLYIPSVGFFVLLAQILTALTEKKGLRWPVFILGAGLCLFYSVLTFRQNNYWKEPIPFYERTLRYVPESPRLLVNLGALYSDAGRNDEAIALYKKAASINPLIAATHYNLGLVYYETGKKEEAIASFHKALELDPKYAAAYNSLGQAYSDKGEKEEAIAYFKKAIEADPGFVNAMINMGVAYAAIGKTDDAVAAYQKAIAVAPGISKTYYNLGIVYYGVGKMPCFTMMKRNMIWRSRTLIRRYSSDFK
jgi:protein O-mannosyl-transferase